jgi:hypothetical protein
MASKHVLKRCRGQQRRMSDVLAIASLFWANEVAVLAQVEQQFL